MRRPVVPRAHRPIALAFGIPAHGHLHEPPVCVSVQKRARVIARADDVVGLELERVRLLSAEADLMAALKQLSIALGHAVMAVGCLVIEASAFATGKVARAGTYSRKRTPHAREGVGARDFVMAGGADGRIGVGSGKSGLRSTRRCAPHVALIERPPSRIHQR